MFGTIRTRLAVLYAGLFAAALGLVAATLYFVVDATAERQVRSELVASSTVFDRIWKVRAHELGNAAGVLARDFGFRAAVATGDRRTAESALENLKTRLGLDVAFIVGVDGSVTGIANPAARRDAAKLWPALDQGEMRGVATLGGVPRQLVAAPVMAPALTGWVVFASDLDQRQMHALEGLSAIPIDASVVPAASARAGVPGELGRFLEESSRTGAPGRLRGDDGVSIALAKPLPAMAGGEGAVLLLRYPLARAMAAYLPLQIAMAATGLLGLILLIAGSWRLSLSITRPISALDAAARRMEQGETVEVAVATQDEIGRLARSFNAMAAGIAERERRITQLAFNDSLTGLPNRAYFRQHLDIELRQAAHRRRSLVLLSLDLDNFKAVNDTLGHPTGDALLCAVAARLKAGVGEALVARLGGDEFTIVASPEAGDAGAARMAQRVLEALAQPVRVDGQELNVAASIGIAIAPEDGADSDTLLKNADLALYQAKEAGRATYRFFEARMNAEAQARRTLETDLRRALGAGELELYFQPIVALATGRIASFEALLRWNHPSRGLVSPLEFIPVAEETGLIVPIGEWVIQQACRAARTWPEEVRIAVNVSSVQFRRSGLGASVVQALAASGLDPKRLEIEITESIFLETSDSTLSILHSLREMGVRIALDDFGTGYSSLSYLQSFPFDKIKIDRSFVERLEASPGAAAIVQAITALAAALGMETTAEGIETDGQLEAVRRLGCGLGQGYLFSRPVRAAAALKLLGRSDQVSRAA
jgi:diguanylate cyclase (GGDEF)-like protein